jgi:hypothetical protein
LAIARVPQGPGSVKNLNGSEGTPAQPFTITSSSRFVQVGPGCCCPILSPLAGPTIPNFELRLEPLTQGRRSQVQTQTGCPAEPGAPVVPGVQQLQVGPDFVSNLLARSTLSPTGPASARAGLGPSASRGTAATWPGPAGDMTPSRNFELAGGCRQLP